MKAPAMFVLGAMYASTWWAAARWPTMTANSGEEVMSVIWVAPTIGTVILCAVTVAYCIAKWDN